MRVHLLAYAAAATVAWPLMSTDGAPAARPASPADVLVGLNHQRHLHRLPVGLVEDPLMSSGCRLHVRYLELNARPGWTAEQYHEEDPRFPGYTSLGARAGRSGGLDGDPSADAWRRGINGFRHAPFHEMRTLSPLVHSIGWATSSRDGRSGHSCLAIGEERPSPQEPTVFTYPGDGARIYPAEITAEMPYPPTAVLGVPATTLTGPHLMVWAVGSEPPPAELGAAPTRLENARLDGPDGPVPVGVIDGTRRGPGGRPSLTDAAGGMIIPLRPLEPHRAYRASVTIMYGGWKPITHSWRFATTASTIDWSTIGVLQDPQIVARISERSSSSPVTISIRAGKAAGRRAVVLSRRVTARCPNPAPRGRSLKFCDAKRHAVVLRPRQQVAIAREPGGQIVTVEVDRFAIGDTYQTLYREFSWMTVINARGCGSYRCTVDRARSR